MKELRKNPRDNWEGARTLEREIPYFTTASIIRLDSLLTKGMSVLEFGSGGSTLFFSKRCKFVVSYESDRVWFDKTSEIIRDKKITNVKIIYYENHSDLRNKFSKGNLMPKDRYDCISIDNAWKVIDRDTILSMCMPITSKLLILDNYSAVKGFPLSHGLNIPEFKVRYSLRGYRAETYDTNAAQYGGYWKGSGTRIFIKD